MKKSMISYGEGKSSMVKPLQMYRDLSKPMKSAIWFTIINFFNTGLSVLTTPIFTRLLSTAEMGVVSVYNTWESIITICLTLNLAYGIYEIMLVDYKSDKHRMTLSLVMSVITLCGIGLLILLVCPQLLMGLVGLPRIMLFIMLTHILVTSVVSFWITQKKFEYDYRPCSIVMILSTVLRVGMSLAFVVMAQENRAFFRILGMALPDYILGAILLGVIVIKAKGKVLFSYAKQAIAFNIVLIPHYLSGILLSSSDRIMIMRMVNEDKAGIYSLIYSCAALLNVLFASLSSVFTPFAYKSLQEGNFSALSDKSDKLIQLTMKAALLLILLAPEAVAIFAPPTYYEGIPLIPALVLGIYMTFLYALFGCVEFYYKKNKFITMATLLGAAINIVLNLIFIPKIGYTAAAYTTFIGYAIMAFAHGVFTKQITKEQAFDYKKITYSMLFLTVAAFLIMQLYDFIWIRLVLALVVLVLAAIDLKNNFMTPKNTEL